MDRFSSHYSDLVKIDAEEIKKQLKASSNSAGNSPVVIVNSKQDILSHIADYAKTQLTGFSEAKTFFERSQYYMNEGSTKLAQNDFAALTNLVTAGQTTGLSADQIQLVENRAKCRHQVEKKQEMIDNKIQNISGSEQDKATLQHNLSLFKELVQQTLDNNDIRRLGRQQLEQTTSENDKEEEECNEQVEEKLNHVLNIVINNDDPKQVNNKLLQEMEELKKLLLSQQKLLEQQQAKINNHSQELKDMKQKMKDAGVYDKAYVNRGFIDLQNKDPDLFLYCKTFYWTALNIFNAYKIVGTGIVSGNHKSNFNSLVNDNQQLICSGVSKGIQYVSQNESIKNGFKVATSVLKAVPFVGSLITGIDDIVSTVVSALNFAQNQKELSAFEKRVKAINTVILSKFCLEDQISLTLAKVALKLTEQKEQQILSMIKSNGFIPTASYAWFEDKLKSLKPFASQQMELAGNNTKNEIAMLAIRDVSLFISYICNNSDEIANSNENNVDCLIIDIVQSKSLEKLVKDKSKSMIKLEKKKKKDENKKKQKCTIF